MSRRSVGRLLGIRVTALGLAGVVAACGGSGSPIHPSATRAGATATPGTSPGGEAGIPLSAAAALTPSDLTERGWTCFQPPVQPVRTICSHPNQGLPVVGSPPPADRPATYNLWRFDATGSFVGTVHLIRADLYNGQVCGPSGDPYLLVPIIGYYECLVSVGR